MLVLFVKYISIFRSVLLNQPMTSGRPLGIFHGPPVVQSLRTTVPFLRFHFNFFLLIQLVMVLSSKNTPTKLSFAVRKLTKILML